MSQPDERHLAKRAEWAFGIDPVAHVMALMEAMNVRLSDQLAALQRHMDETERHRREMETEHAKAVAAAFAAAEKAVEKAEAAQARVNAGQNEFRGTLSDQAATLMPRKEVEGLLGERDRQIGELRAALAELRTNIAVGPPDVSVLKTQQAQMSGGRAATDKALGYAFGAAGILIALGTLAVLAVERL